MRRGHVPALQFKIRAERTDTIHYSLFTIHLKNTNETQTFLFLGVINQVTE